jgi:ubiquinone/menaquinone biosynthesis C-methylase UbiE
MVELLQQRAETAKLANLTAILGDATKPFVAEASFDLVFLVTTLGEIPDRAAALAQPFRALKPGGILSTRKCCLIPIINGDPPSPGWPKQPASTWSRSREGSGCTQRISQNRDGITTEALETDPSARRPRFEHPKFHRKEQFP